MRPRGRAETRARSPSEQCVNGLLVGALRARSCSESLAFLPAKPAYQERVPVSQTRSQSGDLKAEQAQIQKLNGELIARQALIEALEQRLALFHGRRAQFELVTPFAGAVFGEDLPRQTGQHFRKGAEICRVADTHRLLLRIRVPETEIGDVQVGEPVRLKARAFPNQLFRGTVSRIGSESEPDEHRRMTYRVELIVENRDGLLRVGMTAFARIDFDRQIIGQILLHKLKQALRPELWML